MNKPSYILVLGLTLVAGCADDGPPIASPPEEAPLAQSPADGRAETVAAFARGGDFRFSLEDSQVLADVERKCAATGAPDACLAEIRHEAAGEGVEIAPLGDDRIRYVSYAHENGERVVLIDGDARVVPVEEGIVELLPANMRVGKVPPNARLLVEVVDDDTIAMDKQPGAHPRTGGKRLVFHRQAR
jgi:hypothetical protein